MNKNKQDNKDQPADGLPVPPPIDPRGEKYLREGGVIEDMPDQKDVEEAEQKEKESTGKKQ
jgi:hypothetical protein